MPHPSVQQGPGRPGFGLITMLQKKEPGQARDKPPILQMRELSPRGSSHLPEVIQQVNDSGTSAPEPYSAPLPAFNIISGESPSPS